MYTPLEEEQSYLPFKPDVLIKEDQTMTINDTEFEFIKVPGQTLESMAIKCERDQRSMLFTGDMLQPEDLSLNLGIFGWPGDHTYDMQTIVDSMMKLKQVDVDMVLPWHGKMCLRNGTTLLQRAVMEAYISLR